MSNHSMKSDGHYVYSLSEMQSDEFMDAVTGVVCELTSIIACAISNRPVINIYKKQHRTRGPERIVKPRLIMGFRFIPPETVSKPVTEEVEDLLPMCVQDQGELKAYRGSSPRPLGIKNAHAHTTHTNGKKGIHHPPSYGSL